MNTLICFVFLKKTHACAGTHASALLPVPWNCTSWIGIKFVPFVFCPLWCFPLTRPPTNACHSWFATSPVAPAPGSCRAETGAKKRNTCLSLNWAEKKEEENDKIIACSTLFMRTSFQWYMSAPGESIVSPLTYFKCQGCHARRQWWTSLNRIWFCSHVQSYPLKVYSGSAS